MIKLSDNYPLRFRRAALQLVLAIIRPLDAWSMILLESNFIEILATCQLELCDHWEICDISKQIADIASRFEMLHCRCAICLRALKVRPI